MRRAYLRRPALRTPLRRSAQVVAAGLAQAPLAPLGRPLAAYRTPGGENRQRCCRESARPQRHGVGVKLRPIVDRTDVGPAPFEPQPIPECTFDDILRAEPGTCLEPSQLQRSCVPRRHLRDDAPSAVSVKPQSPSGARERVLVVQHNVAFHLGLLPGDHVGYGVASHPQNQCCQKESERYAGNDVQQQSPHPADSTRSVAA